MDFSNVSYQDNGINYQERNDYIFSRTFTDEFRKPNSFFIQDNQPPVKTNLETQANIFPVQDQGQTGFPKSYIFGDLDYIYNEIEEPSNQEYQENTGDIGTGLGSYYSTTLGTSLTPTSSGQYRRTKHVAQPMETTTPGASIFESSTSITPGFVKYNGNDTRFGTEPSWAVGITTTPRVNMTRYTTYTPTPTPKIGFTTTLVPNTTTPVGKISIKTILTLPVKVGERKLQVSSQAGCEPGMDVVIDKGVNEERRKIAALGSIILDRPLEKPHPAGCEITVYTTKVTTTPAPTIKYSNTPRSIPGVLVTTQPINNGQEETPTENVQEETPTESVQQPEPDNPPIQMALNNEQAPNSYIESSYTAPTTISVVGQNVPQSGINLPAVSQVQRVQLPPTQAPFFKAPSFTPAPTSQVAPTQEAPTKAAPTQSAPTQSAPTQAAPTQAAPTQAAPTQAAPIQAAPTQAAPTQAAPIQAQAASPQIQTPGPEPIDCEVIGWGEWTPCKPGSNARTRTQITNNGPFNGGAACPALETETDTKTCPIDCKYNLDFSNNVTCDTQTGKKNFKVTLYEPGVNGGAECTFNYNKITEVDQTVLSNIDCSVNCTATYSGADYCDSKTGNYYRLYNVNTSSINQGNMCTVNDGTYSIIIDASAGPGEYVRKVGSCADCSYTLALVECNSNGYRKYNVTSYIPAVNNGKPCSYMDGTAITTVGQQFISTLDSDKCSNCSYSTPVFTSCTSGKRIYNVSNFVPSSNGGSACPPYKDAQGSNIIVNGNGPITTTETCANCAYDPPVFSSCTNNKRVYNVTGYSPASNGGSCNPYRDTNGSNISVSANGLITTTESCTNCSYDPPVFSSCNNNKRIYNVTGFVGNSGGGAACPAYKDTAGGSITVSANGPITTTEPCADCCYNVTYLNCNGNNKVYNVTNYSAASGGGICNKYTDSAGGSFDINNNGQIVTTEACGDCSYNIYKFCNGSKLVYRVVNYRDAIGDGAACKKYSDVDTGFVSLITGDGQAETMTQCANVPLFVSGCILWLDGSDFDSITASKNVYGTVSMWKDKSGKGNNFDGSTKAVVGTKQLNGLNLIDLTPVNSYFTNRSFSLPESYTIVFIGYTTVSSGSAIITSCATNNILQINTNDGNINVATGNGNLFSNSKTTDTTQSALNPFIYSIYVDKASNKFTANFNGSLQSTGTSQNIASSGLIIGTNSSGRQLWNGYIGEFIIFDKVISNPDLQYMEGYLASKWGLMDKLPSTHKYKDLLVYGKYGIFMMSYDDNAAILLRYLTGDVNGKNIKDHGRYDVTFSSSAQKLVQSNTYRNVYPGDNGASESIIGLISNKFTLTNNFQYKGFSIAFWFYNMPLGSGTGPWGVLRFRSDNVDLVSITYGISSWQEYYIYDFFNQSKEIKYFKPSDTSFKRNDWNHYVITVDNADNVNKIKYYINETLIGTLTPKNFSIPFENNILKNCTIELGGGANGTYEFNTDGYYQQFRLYDFPINSTMIHHLYGST